MAVEAGIVRMGIISYIKTRMIFNTKDSKGSRIRSRLLREKWAARHPFRSNGALALAITLLAFDCYTTAG